MFLHVRAGNFMMRIKVYLAILVLSLNCLTAPVASANVVLIITDDQDSTLDGMTPMINTLNLIASQGATFTNCFVASPICCPNRASILTGRYQHNHLTVNNSIAGGCNSAQWQKFQEPATFAALLRNIAGYKTFYAGKYLNEYGNKKVGGATHVPIGWDWWAGLVGNSKYYDYSLSINGTEIKYGNSTSDYLTDVILCMKEMACKCQDAANNTFSCIRRVSSHFNNIFCIFEDDQRFIESYDINFDEYEMTNIGYTMKKELRHRFRKRLKRMTVCRYEECVFTNLGSKFEKTL